MEADERRNLEGFMSLFEYRRFLDHLVGRRKHVALPVLIALSSLPPASVTGSDLLYEVTWSTPPHMVGEPPRVQYTGVARQAPTYDRFGESEVVERFGTLTNQPLHLIPTGTNQFLYAQQQYNLGGLFGFYTDYTFYRFEMSLYLDHFAPDSDDRFSFFVDTGTLSAVSLRFFPNGEIHDKKGNIGSFHFGRTTDLRVDVDLPTNTWLIYIDGGCIFCGTFFYTYPADPNPPESLFSFRTNLSDDPDVEGSPQGAIDNVVAWADFDSTTDVQVRSPDQQHPSLHWVVMPAKRYRLQESYDLAAWRDTGPLIDESPGTTINVPLTNLASHAFYRLGILPVED
jgi:hypothetical protein